MCAPLAQNSVLCPLVTLHHTPRRSLNRMVLCLLFFFIKAAKGTVHRAGVGACVDASEVHVRVLCARTLPAAAAAPPGGWARDEAQGASLRSPFLHGTAWHTAHRSRARGSTQHHPQHYTGFNALISKVTPQITQTPTPYTYFLDTEGAAAKAEGTVTFPTFPTLASSLAKVTVTLQTAILEPLALHVL